MYIWFLYVCWYIFSNCYDIFLNRIGIYVRLLLCIRVWRFCRYWCDVIVLFSFWWLSINNRCNIIRGGIINFLKSLKVFLFKLIFIVILLIYVNWFMKWILLMKVFFNLLFSDSFFMVLVYIFVLIFWYMMYGWDILFMVFCI